MAASKAFFLTRLADLALLAGILLLIGATGSGRIDVVLAASTQGKIASGLLLGFLVGFGIKLPVVPLHSWLPDAHTEAPTEGSVILAVPIAALAVASAVYGAAVAMAQADLKRLIAFTSINHMRYVLLGVAVAAVATASASDRVAAASGATYQLVAHGLVIGALFFLVGILSDRTGTRQIRRLSGIWTALPLYGSILAFAMFASLGLPSLAHFAAEVQSELATLAGFPPFGGFIGKTYFTSDF